MGSAKISELEARLSEYLRRVRRGETVEVLGRETPVARLVPIETRTPGLRITRPTAPPGSVRRVRPVVLKKRVDYRTT